MFFKKKKYKEIEESIISVKEKIEYYINLHIKGIPLSYVLSLLPNEMIVNIHIQPYSFTNLIRSDVLRRLTVAYARRILTKEEINMRVVDIKKDYDYGYDKKRPIAVIEIPGERYWINKEEIKSEIN